MHLVHSPYYTRNTLHTLILCAIKKGMIIFFQKIQHDSLTKMREKPDNQLNICNKTKNGPLTFLSKLRGPCKHISTPNKGGNSHSHN